MKKMTRRLLIAILVITSLSSVSFTAFAELPTSFDNSRFQRVVYMPNGAGPFHYYAQNDPIWNNLVYESANASSQRPFGEGGCNPTALAMVVATLVPTERLNMLGMSAAKGRAYTVCTCSVNKFYCHMGRKDPSHVRSTLITGDDFATALPLAFGDFAAGNNTGNRLHRLVGSRQGGNGGTSKTLFEPIANIYGLSLRISREMSDVIATLDRGGMVIALCSGKSHIFGSGNGHYVVIASYDDQYLYLMDPFVRRSYAQDRKGLIEQLDDGILRIERTCGKSVGFGTYALFEPAPSTYYASLPVLLNPYTREVASISVDGSLSAAGY